MTVIVSGNPRANSRTLEVARAAARALDTPAQEIELSILAARLHAPDDPAVIAALTAVKESDLLVLATPSYKGSFTGLLKLFLDQLPGDSLAGVQVLPVVVAGSAEHAGQTERHLVDVVTALGGTLLPGLAFTETQLADQAARIGAWRDRVATAGEARR